MRRPSKGLPPGSRAPVPPASPRGTPATSCPAARQTTDPLRLKACDLHLVQKDLSMFFFNCDCGTIRPQRVGETIYCLYVLIEETSDNQIILDLHIPFPWCHLIQHVSIVSQDFYIHSCHSINPGEADRATETLSFRRRLPIGASFIAMCNQHQLFVKPM